MTVSKVVVPDQGEIWYRQYWRHKETIGINFIAQLVTLQEILPKNDPLT